MKNSLAFPFFLIVVGYLVFAGLAGWWPWNVPVVLNPKVTSLSTPVPTPLATPMVTPEPTLTPVSAVLKDQYRVECQNWYDKTEIFKGQPWYEYLRSRILPGWYMTSACYNQELNSTVYFRANFNPDSLLLKKDGETFSRFGIYNVKTDDFVLGPPISQVSIRGCQIHSWLKTGQIVYKCELGREKKITETYSFDIDSQAQIVLQRCESKVTDYGVFSEEVCVDDPR